MDSDPKSWHSNGTLPGSMQSHEFNSAQFNNDLKSQFSHGTVELVLCFVIGQIASG